jgi:hypothetical protein
MPIQSTLASGAASALARLRLVWPTRPAFDHDFPPGALLEVAMERLARRLGRLRVVETRRGFMPRPPTLGERLLLWYPTEDGRDTRCLTTSVASRISAFDGGLMVQTTSGLYRVRIEGVRTRPPTAK